MFTEAASGFPESLFFPFRFAIAHISNFCRHVFTSLPLVLSLMAVISCCFFAAYLFITFPLALVISFSIVFLISFIYVKLFGLPSCCVLPELNDSTEASSKSLLQKLLKVRIPNTTMGSLSENAGYDNPKNMRRIRSDVNIADLRDQNSLADSQNSIPRIRSDLNLASAANKQSTSLYV